MDEAHIPKRVDESWKEQIEREKGSEAPSDSKIGAESAKQEARPSAESFEARFDLFLSGLAMEALVAMGDVPHPSTKKKAVNLTQAKYLIDLLGILEDKTKGNLTVDEEKLLKDVLYQLRMNYLAKSGS